MATATSSNKHLGLDEGLALVLALGLHAGLAALFIFGDQARQPAPRPQRMTVSLAEDVALTSTAPDPATAASADVAPTLGEAQSEPSPPQPALPVPRPVMQPAPAFTAQPRVAPRPAASQPAKPQPKAAAKPASRPAPKAAGASRIGHDFLKGIGGDSSQPSKGTPAAAIGPKVAASLAQAIARQLKPRWSAPQGVEADRLVTVLSFNLNPDGSLAGTPKVVSQSGVTDANAPQKARHAEQAIRAVQLAAPFDLPEEYYSGWKRVSAFRFDRKLSQ